MSDPNIQQQTDHHQQPAHGHDHGHHKSESPFTPAQWKEFHKSDIGAGGAVIVLMTAIFSIGLVLYAVIAIVVAS
jgi:hypothetical protein